jgi:myo-inositol-1(or 4)-monophosphatase
MDKPSYDELLAFANRLADLSRVPLLQHFRQRLEVDDKSGGSGRYDPVTVADKAAELVIRNAISVAYPSHGILGEEWANEASTSPYQWVIDPIDGTRAFIMGLPLWGTLIGLARDGAPMLGVVDQPYIGERFWSSEAGARMRGPTGEQQLKTRACRRLEDAILSSTTPDMFKPGPDQDRFETIRAKARMTRFGGDCYAYCMLAAGHTDLIVEAGLKPYDVAALVPIIERAGGRITGWDGRPALGSSHVVAAGDPVVHEAALRMLAP